MDPLIITAAFVIGYLIYRLGMPPLVGFLLAGLILSSFGFQAPAMLSVISDAGVTLLLFTIGLKLKIKNLLRPEVWGGAAVHMVLTVALVGFFIFCLGYTGLQFFLDMDASTALLLGFALSFSSTVFAVKILDESGRMNSLNGRTAIGVLIVQDIVAVAYLTFSTGKLPSVWALLVIGLLPLARIIFQGILTRVGHGEMLVLFGLFLALAAGAYAFEAVNLKPDLGALIMGMLLAPHPRAKELADDLMNVKELLLVGFFLKIGLMGLPGVSGLFAAAILVLALPLKMLLYILVFSRFRLKARTSFLSTMNLANFSEFGLIVCAMAAAGGKFDSRWLVVVAIALSASFILAAPLNRYADHIYTRLSGILTRLETRSRHPEEVPFEREPWEIFVLGMGRIGAGVYDRLEERYGKVVLGVDFNLETVSSNLAKGRTVRRHDVTDPDFWRRMPPAAVDGTARLVVMAIPGLEAMLYVARMLKQKGYRGIVAAVAFFDDEVEKLLAAGVDIAFNAYGEAGAGLAAHAIEKLDAFGK
jgi:predicted Kef-type K+ transport protein